MDPYLHTCTVLVAIHRVRVLTFSMGTTVPYSQEGPAGFRPHSILSGNQKSEIRNQIVTGTNRSMADAIAVLHEALAICVRPTGAACGPPDISGFQQGKRAVSSLFV